MTKGFMLVAAVAGAVLGAERADACATVTFTQSSVVGWDPLRGTNGIAQLTATVQRVSPNTRAARLIFSDSHGTNQIGPSGAGAGPDYVIRDVNGTIVSFPVNTLVSQRSEGGEQRGLGIGLKCERSGHLQPFDLAERERWP
jgi:hypothetical protein